MEKEVPSLGIRREGGRPKRGGYKDITAGQIYGDRRTQAQLLKMRPRKAEKEKKPGSKGQR